MMRATLLILGRAGFVLCLTILSTWSWGHAQEPGLPREVETTLQYFLSVDCQMGVKRSPLDQLVAVNDVQPEKVQAQLTLRLISILNHGPDQRTVDKLPLALQGEWEKRSAFLKKNPKLGLNKEHYALAVKMSKDKDAYVNQRLAAFVSRYRERSAIALGAMPSPEGIMALRKLSKTKDSALRTVIKTALERSTGPHAP
jgi:hypothetical protein